VAQLRPFYPQLADEAQTAGTYHYDLATSDLKNGLNFYQFKVDQQTYSRKFMIQR
jgi:hypothetical protein